MKPVQVRGVFDHENEIQVEKMRGTEKGAYVVTPFYTHLDAQGKENAILVNRGWVPEDLRQQRLHYYNNSMGTIKGVLYRGEALTKYSVPNSPTVSLYTSVRPEDISLVTQLLYSY